MRRYKSEQQVVSSENGIVIREEATPFFLEDMRPEAAIKVIFNRKRPLNRECHNFIDFS